MPRPIAIASASPRSSTSSASFGSSSSPTAITGIDSTPRFTAAANGTWKPGPAGISAFAFPPVDTSTPSQPLASSSLAKATESSVLHPPRSSRQSVPLKRTTTELRRASPPASHRRPRADIASGSRASLRMHPCDGSKAARENSKADSHAPRASRPRRIRSRRHVGRHRRTRCEPCPALPGRGRRQVERCSRNCRHSHRPMTNRRHPEGRTRAARTRGGRAMPSARHGRVECPVRISAPPPEPSPRRGRGLEHGRRSRDRDTRA